MSVKIAIALEGRQVSAHFGHCSHFFIGDDQGNSIVEEELITSPVHEPGAIPAFLKSKNVEKVITGGIGEKARMIFDAAGIEVISGISGALEEVIDAYVSKQLQSDDKTCQAHAFSGQCGHH